MHCQYEGRVCPLNAKSRNSSAIDLVCAECYDDLTNLTSVYRRFLHDILQYTLDIDIL